MVCEVENMMGLARESLGLTRALVTSVTSATSASSATSAQPLVSGSGAAWHRPVQYFVLAGAFVLVFV